jgi:hypothetical protein
MPGQAKIYIKRILGIFLGGRTGRRFPARDWVILIIGLVCINAATVLYHLFISPKTVAIDGGSIAAGSVAVATEGELDEDALRSYAEVLKRRAGRFEELTGFKYDAPRRQTADSEKATSTVPDHGAELAQ